MLSKSLKKTTSIFLIAAQLFGATTSAYADAYLDAASQAQSDSQFAIDNFQMPTSADTDGSFNFKYRDAEGNMIEELQTLFDEDDKQSLDNLFGVDSEKGFNDLGSASYENSSMDMNSPLNDVKRAMIKGQETIDPTSLRSDPIMSSSKLTFQNITSHEMFSECTSTLSINVNEGATFHTPDIKTCFQDTAPKECRLKRVIDSVDTTSSCIPGEVLNVVTTHTGLFANDGGNTLKIEHICTGTSTATFRYSIGAGECSPSDAGVGSSTYGASADQHLGSLHTCEKHFDFLSKVDDHRTINVFVKNIQCDGWRCSGDFYTQGGYTNMPAKTGYFSRQHPVYTVNDRIEQFPPGCADGYSTCSAKEVLGAIEYPSSNDIWQCVDYNNGKTYKDALGATITLDPMDAQWDGIYVGDPESPGTLSTLFEGDPENLVCYEAVSRDYTCENDVQEFCDSEGNCYTYEQDGSFDTCQSFINDNSCSDLGGEAVVTDPLGGALVYQRKFDCGYSGSMLDLNMTEEMTCDGPIKCMGQECVKVVNESSGGQGFGAVMGATSTINYMKQEAGDCRAGMSKYTGDLTADYDIIFYFNGDCMGCKAQAEVMSEMVSDGYAVYGYSATGAGVTGTDFETVFSRDIPDYLISHPADNWPSVYVRSKHTGAYALAGSGYLNKEKVESSMMLLINNDKDNFEDNCGVNQEMFKGQRYECKVSHVGAKFDCCSAEEMGVPTSTLGQAMALYSAGKRLNETFHITEKIVAWTKEAIPDVYNGVVSAYDSVSNGISNAASSIGDIFSSGTSATTEATASASGSGWLAGIGQTVTNKAAEYTGQIFGETAKDAFFSTNPSTGLIEFSPPPYLTYAYYAYVTYQVVMVILEMFFGCDEKDREAVMKREQHLCVSSPYQTEYCSNEFLGVCLTKKYARCCFSNPMVAVLQEEFRRIASVGPNPYGAPTSFGSGADLNCSGFTPKQLSGLDMSLIDNDKLIARLIEAGVIPDQSKLEGTELEGFIQDRFSIDNMTNKSIWTQEDIERINTDRQQKRDSLTNLKIVQLETINELEASIAQAEARKAILLNEYNNLTPLEQASEPGAKKLEDIDNENTLIEAFNADIAAANDSIASIDDKLENDPSLQLLDETAIDSFERDNMPAQFTGKNVNIEFDSARQDFRNEALLKAQ